MTIRSPHDQSVPMRARIEAPPDRDIEIRRATLGDLPAVARLFDGYRRFYGQPADLPRAEHFIAERLRLGDSVILTATAAGSRANIGLGFVQLYPSLSSVNTARVVILNDLFVAEHARQCGVALGLMEATRRYAESIGACRIELATGKDNALAQRLYRRLGYEPNRELEAFSLDLSGIDARQTR